MPRPKLSTQDKRSEVVMVKLRPAERKILESIRRRRRKREASNWTLSAVLREAFVAVLEKRRPSWSRDI